MGLETVIPGHGPVCGLKEVEEYVDALSTLRSNVKDAISSELSVFDFIQSGEIPSTISQGVERFAERSIQHWYNFYGLKV